MRIWNLRRGDDDDNRTSPHGGGIRRILLSTALEFNYVKAAIGFLVLIVGPALLVGIAPSVAVSYGLLKFDTVASAGDTPIVAVVVLLIMLASALWIGRPLLGQWVVDVSCLLDWLASQPKLDGRRLVVAGLG